MIEMLEDLGWKVVEVDGLPALASIVAAVGVLLIRRGASDDELARVADQVLLGSAPAT